MKQSTSSNDIDSVKGDLITKAQNGDAAAFGQLYDDYADRIFRFLVVKIGSRQEAEDLLQDVFLKSWRALPKFGGDDPNFSAWLYKIASNTANDLLRKRYRAPQISALDEGLAERLSIDMRHEPHQQLVDTERVGQLQEALMKLPIQHREILELRFIQEFSVSDCAKIAGRSHLAVRLLQHRALNKLRKLLNES